MPAITPLTATRDSHHCTCLGNLGRCDTDRIISIGQIKYIWCNIVGIIIHNIALNFGNVNDPLESFYSGNIAHFHLEWWKSNWNGTIHERNRENQIRIWMVCKWNSKGQISISLMLDAQYHLSWAWHQFKANNLSVLNKQHTIFLIVL